MIKALNAHNIAKIILETPFFFIYETHKENEKPILIKALKSEYPTREELALLQNEYEVLRKLKSENIIAAIGLEKYKNSNLLLMQHFPGIPLKEYAQRKYSLSELLRASVNIAAALGDIHRNRIIHKNLQADAILINPETHAIKIIDFEHASDKTEITPQQNETTHLAYTSPEMTGRMNRLVDHRTDIYSAGIVLYELLTGCLPFREKDPMELIHSHMVKNPSPLYQMKQSIPEAISAIILKALSKMPEDRYHNAFGLRNDLLQCLLQWEQQGVVSAEFVPGKHDVRNTFQIPQKLYGREKEIKILKDIFAEVAVGGRHWIAITGPQGVGKATLARHIQQLAEERQSYVVSGMFETSKQHLPFSALIQACTNLIRQVLKEKDENLAAYREQLLEVLQDKGQVLIDLIPDLELIIGRQPAVAELDDDGNRNRLLLIFLQFLRVFAQKEHPLVILLGKLHYADSASLNFIKTLTNDSRYRYLLFVTTYRKTDLTKGLEYLLENLQKEAAPVTVISLAPLGFEEVRVIVSETLNCSKDHADALARLLFQKTAGNPYFFQQLFKQLHSEEYITFDMTDNQWKWNLEDMQKMEISSNVIDLLLEKIKKFPEDTQRVLAVGAVFGQKFSVKLIAEILDRTAENLQESLKPAVEDRVVQPIAHDHDYQFVHYRLKQAAESLIPQDQRMDLHYQIGMKLREQYHQEKLDSTLFEAVSHLNEAKGLLISSKDRKELAMLNLQACRKAKASSAYALAYENIQVARSLLEKDSWQQDYDLTYAIYLELADCVLLLQKFEEIDPLSDVILSNARTRLDKGRFYEIQLIFYNGASDYENTFKVGFAGCKLFGIHLERNASKLKLLPSILKIKTTFLRHSVESLEAIPVNNDPEHVFLGRFLTGIMPMAFLFDKHLVVLLIREMLHRILTYGNTPETGQAFVSTAIIIGVLFRDYKLANELGAAAVRLMDKNKNPADEARILYTYALLVYHWGNSYKGAGPLLDRILNSGLHSGELFFLSYIVPFYGFGDGTFFKDLPDAYRKLHSHKDILFATRNLQGIQSFYIRSQFCVTLMNQNYIGPSITDDRFDEEAYHKRVRNNPQFMAAYQGYTVYKMTILYLFGYHREAQQLYDDSAYCRDAIKLIMTEKDLYFFYAMNLAALASSANFWKKRKLLKKIKMPLKFMQKAESTCPASNSHRVLLIQAEIARLNGKSDRAIELYDQAIRIAKENEFVGEEGLANELCANLYLKQGKRSVAKAYLNEAYYAYYRWGAKAKTAQLERIHPQLLQEKIMERSFASLKVPAEATKHTNFDVNAVIRASSTLSKEIHFEKLLDDLLSVVIVEAGADRAVFLTYQEGHCVIEGEKKSDAKKAELMLNIPFDQDEDLLPTSIVKYVLRTRETILINNTALENLFSHETYLVDNNIKAVLCLPVVYQEQISAILYLENSSASDVFTVERVRILEMLSSQIATSIQNSGLYSQLEEYNRNLENKVLERTEVVQQKNTELAKTLQELKTTHNQLIESEKQAALGQLVAGIAHEINTPLGAMRASSQNANGAINEIIENLPLLSCLQTKERENAFIELIQLSMNNHQQLSSKEERKIKREHVSNLDEAGIMHAQVIADTLVDMGIYENVAPHIRELANDGLALMNLAYNMTSLLKNNQNVQVAVDRASKIVFALKTYVQQEESGKMESGNLVEGLDSVLTLYHHQLKHGVTVEKHYEEVPLVECRMHELNQVWTNLIHNAIQAMNNKGTLEVALFAEGDDVFVEITDSGKGIPLETQPRLFTPFFTTKARGEGSGLGLSISKQIIESHGGEISFKSRPGKTTFTIRLPKTQSAEKAA